MSLDVSRSTRLILASASPRRAQLLRDAGYVFEVIPSPLHEPEPMAADIPPAHQAEAVSYFKARSVAATSGPALIIAADTIVACEGEVFGKPVDADDARQILQALVGHTQQVITGVTLLDATTRQRLIRHDTTTVVMRYLTEEAIDTYIASGEWQGKAGAYGIQDQGDTFIERIAGSFTNVVGLPMELLAVMLLEWGYQLPTRLPSTP